MHTCVPRMSTQDVCAPHKENLPYANTLSARSVMLIVAVAAAVEIIAGLHVKLKFLKLTQ